MSDTQTREHPGASERDAPKLTDEHSTDDGSTDDGGTPDKNWLEWAVSLAGAAIVLGVIGFLVYQLAWGSDEPAKLEVELGTPTVADGTARVPVTVRNTGDRVASHAVIEVCAGPDACAQLMFDYVPFASKQTGSVGLDAPLAGPLQTRVVSYRNP